MAVDPRTPVVVGVAQRTYRPTGDLTATPEPAEMMAAVLRLADADTHARASLVERADAVRTIGVLSWRYTDPAAEVARRLKVDAPDLSTTATGGNGPQWLLNRTATDIRNGDLDVALLVGAEAMYTRLKARTERVRLPWSPLADGPPARMLGEEKPGNNDAEGAVGLVAPPIVYPLFENALRAAARESIDEHDAKVADLWSRFSRVAAANPHAWQPEAKTPDEIATPTPANRRVSFPYTKLENANLQVDQAAALVVCSLGAARAAGVPDDRMVFPLAGADANDHWWVSSRWDLHSSPAIAAAGRAALDLAALTIDDVAHVDLYSCFPSAVQIGAAALGLGLDRDLTVTGGLTFAGGPGNNYATHSIATLVDRLRANPGDVGLVTALGWYVTKHAVGLYGTTPPTNGFRAADAQPQVDATPSRAFTTGADGPVTIESYTVSYDRDGSPALGIAACLLPDGTRTWASTSDAHVLEEMTTTEACGRPAVVTDGRLMIRA